MYASSLETREASSVFSYVNTYICNEIWRERGRERKAERGGGQERETWNICIHVKGTERVAEGERGRER